MLTQCHSLNNPLQQPVRVSRVWNVLTNNFIQGIPEIQELQLSTA